MRNQIASRTARIGVTFLTILAAMSVAAAHGEGTMSKMDMSRYGGPVYTGAPALAVTASLVNAGGGMDWSAAAALKSMLGEKITNAEIEKLTTQFGKEKIDSFVNVHNFAMHDALEIATAAGVKLPEGALSGKKLALALVKAGQAKDGTFYTEYLLDKAITHKIHSKVMDDIDAKYGADADENYHIISNQAFFDIGKAFGVKNIKLANSK